MNKEEKRINYLLDTIIECPSMQADELRKRIRRLFKTIEKQRKEMYDLKTELSYYKEIEELEMEMSENE